MRKVYEVTMVNHHDGHAGYTIAIDKEITDQERFGLYTSIIMEAFESPDSAAIFTVALDYLTKQHLLGVSNAIN